MLSLVNAVHDTNASPSPRRSVGPYRLCIELASGGMASVYLAQPELGCGRPAMVAVKLIHPHLANDAEFVQMFMDEAELASQIRHANVCGVLDYAHQDGEYYIVMEYLLGESLMSIWNRIARRTCDDRLHLARCVARILSDACEGLHAAHQLTDVNDDCLEIVHRDVSPENVFVTYDGVAKVMDFGVASAARKRHRTQTGLVKGKFAYVAPELLRGAKADRRADVWGIGVIAWELLTGKRLFRRDTDLNTLQAVNDEPIPKPSQVVADVPKEIEEIVMRALVRDPEGRYATARELARDLARFAARGDCVITSADVADWLDVLVPGGKVRRRQILELARMVDGEEREITRVAGRHGSLSTPPAPRRPSPSDHPAASPASDATTLWDGGTRTPRSAAPPAPASTPASASASASASAPAAATAVAATRDDEGRARTFGRAAALLALGFACGGAVAYAWPAWPARMGASATAPADLAVPAAVTSAQSAGALARDGEILLRIHVEQAPHVPQPVPAPQVYVPPPP